MNNPSSYDEEKTVLQDAQLKPAPVADPEPSKKGGPTWKSVMMGGIPGILLGVGGVFAAQGFVLHGDEPSGGETPVQSQGQAAQASQASQASQGVEEPQIPVADSVNDDMSFREAFDAARAEVGPGGAFSWHGNVYSTYRSDDPEWVEMGPDGQAEHCHDIVAQVHAEPYYEDVPTDGTDQVPEVEVTVDDMDDSGEVDVHIIGVENDPESGASVAYGYVDGHATVFIDSDGDGEIDIVAHDENDDGMVDDNELFDAEGSGVTIGDLAQEVDTGNDVELYDGQSDYSEDFSSDFVNDGDVSGF